VANEKENGSSANSMGPTVVPENNDAPKTGVSTTASPNSGKFAGAKVAAIDFGKKPHQQRVSVSRELAKVKAKRASHRRNLRRSNTSG
jgi:hypothetical protein